MAQQIKGRITRDALYMSIAGLFSQRGACERAKVGAVIIREGRIISTGYNGPPKGTPDCQYRKHGWEPCDLSKSCERAIHAEENAIVFASREGISVKGCTMYCTFSPCKKCAESIIQSGIEELVYLEEFRDTKGLELLRMVGIKTRKYE